MLVCLALAGCTAEAPDTGTPVQAPAAAAVDGFRIPVFATAAEQLNYTKSLSANPHEKEAALKLMAGRFPHDRSQLGEARLELAYLHLGDDFRLADQSVCTDALVAYEAVAREFSDLPAIRAKAYWYMGWIYTDLLKETSRGLALYALLAEKHPQDSFSRIFPVPWLKLVFPNPQVRPYTDDDRHTHSWAGLALLEIVRHAGNARLRRQAFDKLWQDNRHSLTTGYALKAILLSRTPIDEAEAVVAEYVRGNTVNVALNDDLWALLARPPAGETAD